MKLRSPKRKARRKDGQDIRNIYILFYSSHTNVPLDHDKPRHVKLADDPNYRCNDEDEDEDESDTDADNTRELDQELTQADDYDFPLHIMFERRLRLCGMKI
jgi:hypothetical protein